MLGRVVVLLGTLSVAILMSCGGKGAGESSSQAGEANHAGTAGDRGNTDMAGRGGAGGGPTGTLPYPPGCESGVIGSETACVSATDAWTWAAAAGGTTTMATGGASGGAGDAGAASGEAGMGGAVTEAMTPEGCPATHLIDQHLEFHFTTVYAGGTRMGDECCYTSFQPCG